MIEIIKKTFNFIWKYISAAVLLIVLSFLIVFWCWSIWDYNLTQIKKTYVTCGKPSQRLKDIRHNILKATEVANRVPPVCYLYTIDSLRKVNAFASGHNIYFTFAADSILNKDEIALIMGHEIAHVILHHTDNEFQLFVKSYSNENELMSDNLGAFWAHKAGYDVCKGREIFNKFYEWGGNSLNAIHPPNKMRYDNLEIYCGDK